MVLKDTHESLDEIPEAYRELYTEKNGVYELTGISGVKTENDFARIRSSLDLEKKQHEETRGKLATWSEIGDREEILKKLDRLPELEAAAKGKLNEDEIEAIVQRRVDGTKASLLAPMERDVKTLKKQLKERDEVIAKLSENERVRSIDDEMSKALVDAKVLDTARDDVKFIARHIFERREDDGKLVTKEGCGYPPGMEMSQWLIHCQDIKRHWWGATRGGGAPGSGVASPFAGMNPWSSEHWNMTQQAHIFNEKGREYAEQMAKAAGTTLGGPKPIAK